MITCESEQPRPYGQAQTTDLDAILQIDDHFKTQDMREETKEPSAIF